MQVHRNHVWALGGMALILLITYFIWNLHTLWELFENKTKVENELERSSTLIHCVTELSANQDVDEAINHLLEIINQYFKSDRTYIFEIDEERQIVHNSYLVSFCFGLFLLWIIPYVFVFCQDLFCILS